MIVLRAKFIAPITTPLIADGAIVIERGRIVAVGRASDLLPDFPASAVTDLGDAVVLPGLVNAHVHLELSTLRASDQPQTSFTDWLLARVKAPPGPPIDFAAATQLGIERSLRFGITTVGDITQQQAITRPILSRSKLTAVSFGEALGVGPRRPRFEQLLASAQHPAEGITVGVSPHAPYSVDLAGFRECVRIAREQQLPLATHLAESPHEREFLQSHTGPFRELLESIGSWQDDIDTFRGSPVEMAAAIGLLDLPRALLAHVNDCSHADLDLLARGRASIVYCPRTHAYFRHRPHRWREMLSRGMNVSVGTDSCASSPDLNLVDDLRLLHALAPDVPASELWRLATINGAKALGLSDQLGSITVGKRADIIAFLVDSTDPLAELLERAQDRRKVRDTDCASRTTGAPPVHSTIQSTSRGMGTLPMSQETTPSNHGQDASATNDSHRVTGVPPVPTAAEESHLPFAIYIEGIRVQ